MKLSKKRQSEMYRAIHDPITYVRLLLRLPPNQDVVLAQVEHKIWAEQKKVLGIPPEL